MFSEVYCTQHYCASMTLEEIQKIYTFCNSLMEETWESFYRHVLLHEIVYLFKRRSTKELVGVSYWRNKKTINPRVGAIVQGKLRIHKDYRGLGLHNQAGLYYYIRCQLRQPLTRFYFVSIASIFNYVSMRKTVGEYHILNQSHSPSVSSSLSPIYPILHQLLDEDKFTIDPETKAINVYVRIRDSVINEFPSSYFNLKEVEEYTTVNPKWREAHDIAYCYPFTFLNVLYILFRILDQSYVRPFKAGFKRLKN